MNKIFGKFNLLNILLLSIYVLVVSVPSVAAKPLAATLDVCQSGCAYSSVQDAINAASNGDVIQIGAGTYTESITINKDLTINGVGVGQTILQAATTRGTASTRVITIASGAAVTISGVTIQYGNTTDYGGGILNHGFLTANNVSIRENDTGSRGGGVACVDGDCQFTSVTIEDNFSSNWGGGMYVEGSTVELLQSLLVGNSAQYNGGGVYVGDNMCSKTYTLDVINSTLSGNTVTNSNSRGGGVYLSCEESTLNLYNSTIAGNQAQTAGAGVLASWYSNLNFYSSIIADNTGTDQCVSESNVVVTDLGYNIVEDGTCISVSTSFSGDPGLQPLADNNGATLTHALAYDSPAIDAGDCSMSGVTMDQRGESRSDWGCDIGAFEVLLSDHNKIRKNFSQNGVYTFGPIMAKVDVSTRGCLTGLDITRTENNHPNANANLQTGRYWTIEPLGCTDGFVVNLTLPHNTEPDANDKLCRYSGSAWDCAADAFDTSNNTITRNSVTQFSDWVTGDDVSPTVISVVAFGSSGSNIMLLTLIILIMSLFGWLAVNRFRIPR